MSNLFMRRKIAARPMGHRALRRRAMPSPRQQQRALHNLKDIASRRIRRSLQERSDPIEPGSDVLIS